jgi:hypothetical protein
MPLLTELARSIGLPFVTMGDFHGFLEILGLARTLALPALGFPTAS